MKKYIIITLLILGMFGSCNEELEIVPQAVITEEDAIPTEEWIEQLVNATYGILDGNLDNSDVWRAAASNWVYGELSTDNAYKGSEPGDQPDLNSFETYAAFANSTYLDYKWRAVYEGINRGNIALNTIKNGLKEGTVTQEDINVLEGEILFLRAHYHFEAKKIWNMIPYVDETVTTSIPNVDVDSWSLIEQDFQNAIERLPESRDNPVRASKWTAIAYLAKAHMYQLDFAAAKPLLDDLITNGPFELNALYQDNFNFRTDNSPESVFAAQFSANDGSTNGSNGNWGDVLNFPQTSAVASGCCGFFQPSQNLVNAFRTDENGLPLLDTFNDMDVKNDRGIASDEPFKPTDQNLDPRLDWTVGRRGINFLGWDVHPGSAWIRDPANGGPYLHKKTIYAAEDRGTANATNAWSQGVSAQNINIIRYAEVLLWRAEIAAQEGDLGIALDLVNQIRRRAANSAGFVEAVERITNNNGELVELRGLGIPAANYVIREYPSFPNQEFAIKAVNFERRIELAMEGHRFFDLVRQERAAEVLNEYLSVEKTKTSHLSSANFTAGQDEYFPLPQSIIDLSFGVLKQNRNQ